MISPAWLSPNCGIKKSLMVHGRIPDFSTRKATEAFIFISLRRETEPIISPPGPRIMPATGKAGRQATVRPVQSMTRQFRSRLSSMSIQQIIPM